jgi:hypothetical protein
VKTHFQPRQAQCLLACQSWAAAQSENPFQRHATRLLPCRWQALSANEKWRMGHFPLRRQRGKADAGFFMHERQAATCPLAPCRTGRESRVERMISLLDS